MHHWYPEGYIGYTRQTQIPVWKKSYYDLPLVPHNTDGPNPPTTSRSTGELLGSGTPQSTGTPSSFQSLPQNTQSALVFNTGAGPVSTSRLPLPQGTALAGNYQKVPNIASTKVTLRGKAGHSSTVVPASPSEIRSATKSFYNMNADPTSHRVPRVDSICGPSSVRTAASAKRMELAILEPPPWDGVSEFIDGSTYFKIGECVYIRRWHAAEKIYTPWLPGRVVRPDFSKAPDGREERRYVVSYQDMITGTQKEKIYSPSLKEIRDIRVHLGMPTDSVPAAHSVVSANDNMQTSKIIVNKDSTVFALLQITNDNKRYSVWTPSVCLAIEKPYGYRVRVIAGPLKNQKISQVLDLMPYNAEIAKDLRDAGHRVENSAIDVGR